MKVSKNTVVRGHKYIETVFTFPNFFENNLKEKLRNLLNTVTINTLSHRKNIGVYTKKSPPVKAGGHLLLVLGYRKSSSILVFYHFTYHSITGFAGNFYCVDARSQIRNINVILVYPAFLYLNKLSV